jgi:hypothetical protein
MDHNTLFESLVSPQLPLGAEFTYFQANNIFCLNNTEILLSKDSEIKSHQIQTILSSITIATGFGLWRISNPYCGGSNTWFLTDIKKRNVDFPNLYNDGRITRLYSEDQIVCTVPENLTQIFRYSNPMEIMNPGEHGFRYTEHLDIFLMLYMTKLITSFEYREEEEIEKSFKQNGTIIKTLKDYDR